MKTGNNSKALAISSYGAAELKLYSPKATTRGFIVTLIIVSILLLIINLFSKKMLTSNSEVQGSNPPTVIHQFDFDLPNIKQVTSPSKGVDATLSGTKSIAGDYKPITDNNHDVGNIATFDNQGNVSSILGKADNINETIKKIDNNESVSAYTPPLEKEDDEVFVPVDKEPIVDLAKLSKSVVYPLMAKQAGIQGKVLVRAYIGDDGRVIKAKIDFSENSIFDDAALNAVRTPGIFQPAIQDNRTVACWVTIPISFKLRW